MTGPVSTRTSDPTRAVPLRTALLATLGTLLVAAVLEGVVYGHGGHDALSDIPGRYFAWGVHSSLLPYQGRPIEYPVVIGYVTWVTSWFGDGPAGFLIANGLLSAAFALMMTTMLHARGGHIWRWALGPPLALYAFHNWDLVAMVPAMAGLMAFDLERDRTSGALLALGAFAKVFPAAFLPPLAVLRWRSGNRRGSLRLVGAFVVTTVVLNGPVAAWSWSSWIYPSSFQGARSATWGSVWYWLLRMPGMDAVVGQHGKALADLLAIAALMGALVVISVLALRRDLDAVAIGGAVVGAFLLSNKIYSPNYDLWIVPFFVLLPVARRAWIGFATSDLAVFVLVYGHFHGRWSSTVVEALLPALLIVRALSIVDLIRTSLRSRPPSPSSGRPEPPSRTGIRARAAGSTPVTDRIIGMQP